ncbi:32125_t:CDS:2, partial [Gigaspora margarita]
DTVNNISEISNVSTSEIDNDESAFEKAKMLADKKECNYNDEIDNCEKSKLTPCILLHMANGKIQRCSNYKQKTQRSLAQLIGTWEIDGKAFKSVKTNQLYTLGHYRIVENNDPNKINNDSNSKLLSQYICTQCFDTQATSDNSEQKKLLLTYLNSTLSFFDKTKSYTSDPPSFLYIKIALRLGQVNLTKIMKNDFDLTPEILKKAGEALGIIT